MGVLDNLTPPSSNLPQNTTSCCGFRAGLTRKEAEKNESLFKLFKTYNKDNNDIISDDEYKIYQQEIEETTDKSQETASTDKQEIFSSLGSPVANFTQKAILSGLQNLAGGTFDGSADNMKKQTGMDNAEVQADCEEGKQCIKKAKDVVEGIKTTNINTQDKESFIEEIAEKINQNIDIDLDETNEKSLINELAKRYENKEFTEEELKYFEENNLDVSKLDAESAKVLAKEMIILKHTINLIDPILDAVQNQDPEAFAKSVQIFMKTQCNTADLSNLVLAIAHRTGKSFSVEQFNEMYNTYAETYQHEGCTNEKLEELVLTDAMTYADAENLQILYQNNATIVDRLNNIAQNVANNTTDETRRDMLNNIVKNSAEIIKNAPNKPNSQNNTNSTNQNLKNNVTPNAPPVSNPIQNAQVNYINELKQQSLEFQRQYMNSGDDVVQENIAHAFSSMREYITFTGTGMTLFEYQETKSTLQNNFTSAVRKIVKDYETMPDVFQNQVLTLFETLDDNVRGELFVNGDQDLHRFMYRYNYMNDSKLFAFAQRKPTEVSNVSPTIKIMLKEIEAEQTKKNIV